MRFLIQVGWDSGKRESCLKLGESRLIEKVGLYMNIDHMDSPSLSHVLFLCSRLHTAANCYRGADSSYTSDSLLTIALYSLKGKCISLEHIIPNIRKSQCLFCLFYYLLTVTDTVFCDCGNVYYFQGHI